MLWRIYRGWKVVLWQVILSWMTCHATFGQINDSFSDGDLSSAPAWFGDAAEFMVNSGFQLQLNQPIAAADTSCLWTPASLFPQTEWNFWLKLGFSPSDNNQCRIYLVSDQPNLKQALNGYFLKIGENLSADGLDLYRQDGSQISLLIDGLPGTLSASVNTVRIKVLRSETGEWSLFLAPSGGTDYALQGTGTDLSWQASGWFGFWCRYTSSNINKFWFDDVYCGPPLVDNTPPWLTSAQVMGPGTLDLTFSEPLDTASVLPGFFEADHMVGTALSAETSPTNPSVLNLAFANPFPSDVLIGLHITGQKDLVGNSMADTTVEFSVHIPQPGDVVLNEIMADPSPPVGLPEYEYIELHNPSPFALDLEGWLIRAGSTTKAIPGYSLPPEGFVTLCSSTAQPLFAETGAALAVPSFPSLLNAGTTVSLLNPDSIVFSTVTYTSSWISDTAKMEGGWSLEKIDPANTCSQQTNWTASLDPSGGTPGRVNSVLALNPDTIAPGVTSTTFVDTATLRVGFSEVLDWSGMEPNSFSLSGLLPSGILPESGDTTALLTFSQPFSSGSTYALSISQLLDVCGNIADPLEISLVYYQARAFDLLIHEIMADPSPPVSLPEAEYLEILNRTDYPINLQGYSLYIGSKKKNLEGHTIPPGGYLIVCPAGLELLFTGSGPVAGLLSTTDLSNAGFFVGVKGPGEYWIHSLEYSIDFFQDAARDDGGWSVEMIDPDNPCGGSSNWHASLDPSGGSPGRANSVGGSNLDAESPRAAFAFPISDQTLRLSFNEHLDSLTVFDPSLFTLTPGIGKAIGAFPEPPGYQTVILAFASPFAAGVIYSLEVGQEIRDCAGNAPPENQILRFGLPSTSQPGDLVVNELLFNPAGDGVDYVEVFNPSQKILNLAEFQMGTRDSAGSWSSNPVCPDNRLIFPGDYIVFTTDEKMVQIQFHCPDPNPFVQPEGMPVLANEQGNVGILNKSLQTIDWMTYHENMQFQLLVSVEGVALERLNPAMNALDPGSWHSASDVVGFGTPGYRNSQFLETDSLDNAIRVEPEIFTPDNDGNHDVLLIRYSFSQPGYAGHFAIFSPDGRQVRELANNLLLDSQGELTWDGVESGGIRAPIGIYLLYAEVFNLQGVVRKFKKPFVLGSGKQ